MIFSVFGDSVVALILNLVCVAGFVYLKTRKL